MMSFLSQAGTLGRRTRNVRINSQDPHLVGLWAWDGLPGYKVLRFVGEQPLFCVDYYEISVLDLSQRPTYCRLRADLTYTYAS